jgi:hypothetical protein
MQFVQPHRLAIEDSGNHPPTFGPEVDGEEDVAGHGVLRCDSLFLLSLAEDGIARQGVAIERAPG